MSNPNSKRIRIFSDGACSGNPGPGGWGVVMLHKEGVLVFGGNETQTTNNRMELQAAIEGIRFAKNLGYKEIEIHTDSSYVANAVLQRWIYKWEKNNWRTASKALVKNTDLWKKMLKFLKNEEVKINFVKVKGHDGNTFNEMADEEAVRQSRIAKEAKDEKGME